jgi:hypothetical protein
LRAWREAICAIAAVSPIEKNHGRAALLRGHRRFDGPVQELCGRFSPTIVTLRKFQERALFFND